MQIIQLASSLYIVIINKYFKNVVKILFRICYQVRNNVLFSSSIMLKGL